MGLYDILHYISTTKLDGFIPLDKVVHFLVGLVWTVYGLKKGYSFRKVFVGLLVIAILKEIHDYLITISPFDPIENFLDISITLLYVAVLYFVRKAKRKLDSAEASPERWKLYK